MTPCQNPRNKNNVPDFTKRCEETARACHIYSGDSVRPWTTPHGRARIEAGLGGERCIADFAPGAVPKKNKGRRGRRAPGRHIKALTLAGRRKAKYPTAEAATITWVRDQRAAGIKVTTRLVLQKMLREVNNRNGTVLFMASPGWVKRFMGRYGLKWRRRNDKSKRSTESLIRALAAFINALRAFRLRHPSDLDPAWGNFNCSNTFNVDQVPLPFASADPRTLEFIAVKRVWIKQPGAGLEKRQCTLQLLIRALGKQPKPTLIFRGNPTPTRAADRRKREEEAKDYDEDVTVIWQKKAWADMDTCVRWSEVSFKEFMDEELGAGSEGLLLCDNLRSQVRAGFRRAVRANARSICMFGV